MIQKFRQFPEPLQRQILLRVVFTVLFLLLTVLSVFFLKDWSTVLISFVLAAFCVINAVWLFYIADNFKYIVISGICYDMTVTPVKRRIKAVLLRTTVDDREVLVSVKLRNRLKKFPPGMQMNIYTSENTLMHEKDGIQQLHGYLAVAIKSNQ